MLGTSRTEPADRLAELRARIGAAYFQTETEAVAALLGQADYGPVTKGAASTTARRLVDRLRAQRSDNGITALLQEYALSSEEGVALMCLAEALLRIPDAATRDALIRDKVAPGDWASHLGGENSLFVNAATWGLVVTGQLTGAVGHAAGLGAQLSRLIARGGEPVIRRGFEIALRLLGEQFVAGQSIGEALRRAAPREKQGYGFSYDMLGEAALTTADAQRYLDSYRGAIHAIGAAAARRGPIAGPGISIKLSALHPRYERTQRDRVMAELLPRLTDLALLAKGYDIGLNIDAEEARRLELSLDLLEHLAFDRRLAGWNGLGFVVQAYGKRAPATIDWLIALARRCRRRLMLRLVKGAYWDTEIKQAQIEGAPGFPVFTRKVHTDVSYLACARTMLAARDAIFPQFATHNAQTLASIHALAGDAFSPGDYEFQCLHGMGEALYDDVVDPAGLARPCRIYAPVGTHDTLLAYLVRRLLENGANSSFVNQIAARDVAVEDLIADPVAVAMAITPVGSPHKNIAAPLALYGAGRCNSGGRNLAVEADVAELDVARREVYAQMFRARATPPLCVGGASARQIRNPADPADLVGTVNDADAAQTEAAFAAASAAQSEWAAWGAAQRAAVLGAAADAMELALPRFVALLQREAGRTAGNGVAEVREAVDFLRYYAGEATSLGDAGAALGTVVCISPWNFPLAIFVGQVAAALAAGNAVLAKPAEETPLIATEAVVLLHAAGVPTSVLHLLPGDGVLGAALVADARTHGVVFTGSIAAARSIGATLARRTLPTGEPVPLVAETGGQNAMIVDSSALAEQVVTDVLTSAFDSAGQRCSALRILCLQDDIADKTLELLKGAAAELVVGDPAWLATDIGPVITTEARQRLETYLAARRAAGCRVSVLTPVPEGGNFFAPAVVEIDEIASLKDEIFGPVLHVVRFAREQLATMLAEINALGFGLTFGVHTRIEKTRALVIAAARAGNIYVNRNMIGAVVGVQPFGGRGLSGTGPKAGGPLYLRRLFSNCPARLAGGRAATLPAVVAYRNWLAANGYAVIAARVDDYATASGFGLRLELPGPVGESNVYRLDAFGPILLAPQTQEGLLLQLAACHVTGNPPRLAASDAPLLPAGLPKALRPGTLDAGDPPGCVLAEGDAGRVVALQISLNRPSGPLVVVQGLQSSRLLSGAADYNLDLLLTETTISTNSAATGGDMRLIMI